jgi:parallel beta-helix repeat protein
VRIVDIMNNINKKRRRVSMNKGLPSVVIIFLLIIGGFIGIMNFENETALGTSVGGIIDTNTTWDLAGSPYIVINDVFVESGVTLTIEPGVQVKFNGLYKIYVDGTLMAVGTEFNRINITSNWVFPDFYYFGEIQINATGHAEIKYCEISYTIWGITLISSSNNNISNNIIHSNQDFGVNLGGSTNNNITSNQIYNNSDVAGIHLSGSSYNIIKYNNISSNHNGISLHQSDNNVITNNNIFLNRDGIYISFKSSNNNITYNNLSHNKQRGIHLFLHSTNNIIAYNNFSNGDGYGIVIEGAESNTIIHNNFTDDGVFITGANQFEFDSHAIPTNNIINGKPLYYYKNSSSINLEGIPVGQVILVNCTNVNLTNLQIVNTDVGIEVAYSQYINITNSNISDNDRYGLYLYSTANNNIKDNNISSNGVRGIFLYYANTNNISQNNILSNLEYGVYLVIGFENNITHNNIQCNEEGGIYLDRANNGNLIMDNNITSNSVLGIILWDSSDSSIINNTILNNGYGIYLFTSSSNSITDNNISRNRDGIYLFDSSDGNTITNNNVYSNTNWGINLSSSTNNLIYHNYFIDNINQSYDDTSIGNQWDAGYPTGGNYWSDYGGVDKNYGPNQNMPGSDSIGDNPYKINPSSWDYYPLWEPFEYYIMWKQGWNLVSIPVIQSDENLSDVLEPIDGYYDAIQWYDITDTDDHWKHYKIGKPFGNDLNHLNETMGFWIHITQPGDTYFYYTVMGPVATQEIELHPGWNLVGYPSLTNKTRDVALNNIIFSTDVDAIQTYDAATKTWEEIGPSDQFELGRGYWVHSKVEKTWFVPL